MPCERQDAVLWPSSCPIAGQKNDREWYDLRLCLRGTEHQSPDVRGWGNQESDHLPHYRIEVHEGSVTFINRSKEVYSEGHDYPRLEPGTYEKAKRVAPGYDIYFLEDEWQRFWVSSGKPRFRSPDGAFIAFCKKRHGMKPLR